MVGMLVECLHYIQEFSGMIDDPEDLIDQFFFLHSYKSEKCPSKCAQLEELS